MNTESLVILLKEMKEKKDLLIEERKEVKDEYKKLGSRLEILINDIKGLSTAIFNANQIIESVTDLP